MKKIFIISGILAFVSLVCGIVAIVMANGDLKSLTNFSNFERNTLQLNDGVSVLTINDCPNVKVSESNSNVGYVDYYTNEDSKYVIDYIAGVLTIKGNVDYKFDLFSDDNGIEVFLPKSSTRLLTAITITSDEGQIDIEDVFVTSINIFADDTNVEISDVDSLTINVSQEDKKLDIDDVNCYTLEVTLNDVVAEIDDTTFTTSSFNTKEGNLTINLPFAKSNYLLSLSITGGSCNETSSFGITVLNVIANDTTVKIYFNR